VMIDWLQQRIGSSGLREILVTSAALVSSVAIASSFVSAAEPANADRSATPRIQLERDDAAGQLRALIDGREAFVYRYGADVDLPHYWPVRSPSGKSMTIQHPDPYPHHRSFWFADKVRLAEQRDVNFYACLYTGQDNKPPYRDHVRHVELLANAGTPQEPVIRTKLLWEMDADKPVLDELREMRVVALGDGEYFLDVTFTVTASYGDVTFTSDATHYAWPYIRMDPAFSVQQGGTITSSEGGVNQKGTNGKEARWIDYSNTVEDQTEGLAVFSHADNEQPHQWLTRDYGCFGPRRVDARSGKPFVLERGESLKRRVGVLVHRGNVSGGKIAERYEAYVRAKL
jgi:hypothetical protein